MSEPPVAFAVAAHPDDIEFMMAGTLLLLREAGWEIHYMNIANGSCGTAVDPPEAIIPKRRVEARDACAKLGAVWHESLCNDLEIFYTYEMVCRLVTVVRAVKPRIVLLQSPQDYMEDHINSVRLGVSAVFCRGMRNCPGIPPTPPWGGEVTVYHAMPHGLRGPLRQRIRPGLYVDISSVLPRKREALACHRSQKEWLDESQGLDAYLDTMTGFAGEVGEMSGCFDYAEGWRRRLHLGFSDNDRDVLGDVLGDKCRVDSEYEAGLERPA
ncbi:MAG: LmbE family protein [Kiritimatiellaeota bacterium]|nr:LmbE family protein [Kiritimatiellota bacterium]